MVTTKADEGDKPYSAKLNNRDSDDNDDAEEGAACTFDEIVDEHADDQDHNDEPEMMFTFDDIPLYARCEYRGHKAWILDKGEDVMDNSSGRHIAIYYDTQMSGRDVSNLHEKVVKRKLEKNDGELWIDFNHRLYDTAPSEEHQEEADA